MLMKDSPTTLNLCEPQRGHGRLTFFAVNAATICCWRDWSIYLFPNFERVATPNDPKLSDRGARRGLCAGEGGWGRRRWEAQAVTCGAVRCSAWLGVAVVVIETFEEEGL